MLAINNKTFENQGDNRLIQVDP